jgi:triosephosphate isomerase (TIM)
VNTQRKPIFAANWKMNKTLGEIPEYVERLVSLLADFPSKAGESYEILIASQALHINALGTLLHSRGTPFRMAAQNCGPTRFGAYTGEISPAVLKELGVEWVIVGHSERRHIFKEEDLLVQSRLRSAMEEGLDVILCVGEVLQDRRAGKTFKVVDTQLSILKGQFPQGFSKRLVIAYEPVWAIGTGENATPAQAQEVHAFIRNWIKEKGGSADEAQQLRILYGGSVKPENSFQICCQPDVDGFLIGSASLDSTTFANVIKNALKSRT